MKTYSNVKIDAGYINERMTMISEELFELMTHVDNQLNIAREKVTELETIKEALTGFSPVVEKFTKTGKKSLKEAIKDATGISIKDISYGPEFDPDRKQITARHVDKQIIKSSPGEDDVYNCVKKMGSGTLREILNRFPHLVKKYKPGKAMANTASHLLRLTKKNKIKRCKEGKFYKYSIVT